MKVGDYVRTKNGNIRKIIKLTNTKYEDDPDYIVDKVLIDIVQNKMEDTIYMEKWLFNEDIIKSSPNIIDLIEVGDYVNGKEIEQIINNELYFETSDMASKISFKEKDIKSIVTKECFESMEYKIESVIGE